jgi:hypothetical protein
MRIVPGHGNKRRSAFFAVKRRRTRLKARSQTSTFIRTGRAALYPRTTKMFRSLRATAYPDRTEFIFVKRPGDVRNWQVLCVCATYNNGWMRQKIDERARPIMIPLIQGQQARLSPDQQRIISTWAVMKAMVAKYADFEYVTTHHTQRKYLMKHHLPPRHG